MSSRVCLRTVQYFMDYLHVIWGVFVFTPVSVSKVRYINKDTSLYKVCVYFL